MKKEDLFQVMGELDEKDVRAAKDYTAEAVPSQENANWKKAISTEESSLPNRASAPRRLARRIGIAAAACVALILVSVAGIRALRTGSIDPEDAGGAEIAAGGSTNTADNGLITVKAEYPEPTAPNMSAQKFMEGDAHYNWWIGYMDSQKASAALQDGMSEYYLSIMKELLGKGPGSADAADGTGNTVCSPLNIYLAVSMLAEISGGNTQEQILDFLGMTDIQALRDQVTALWASNYIDTPLLKSLLANSLWLNGAVPYNADTLDRLATTYYASSYLGDPASEEMNEALRDWTNENTGNLLTDYTKELSLDPNTVLALVSTLYYKAMWATEFSESETSQETFHGTKGDTSVDMMHQTMMSSVYTTDGFTALGLSLTDSGGMYIYLPDEDVAVEDLLSNPEILKASAIMFYEDEHVFYPLVHLSLPKFTVKQKADLREALSELGITDALDASLADFTPLSDAVDPIFVSAAEHAALVEIDEHGVTGAAYTDMMLAGGAMPQDEIDFVVDRPFLFLITGRDNSVLFAGIIRNLE